MLENYTNLSPHFLVASLIASGAALDYVQSQYRFHPYVHVEPKHFLETCVRENRVRYNTVRKNMGGRIPGSG